MKQLKDLVIWVLDSTREEDIHSLIMSAEKSIKSALIDEVATILSDEHREYELIKSKLEEELD